MVNIGLRSFGGTQICGGFGRVQLYQSPFTGLAIRFSNCLSVHTSAIEQYRLHLGFRSWDRMLRVIVAELDLKVLKRASMAPVAYKYRLPLFVPVGTSGTVNNQRASDAIRILERVVTVVPSMTVLSRFEVVCVSTVSSNWTLGNTVNSVSLVCMKLTNAMPMNCGSVVR